METPFIDDDEVGWIISQNLLRRHLTPDQRAGIYVSAIDWRKQRERVRAGCRPIPTGILLILYNPPATRCLLPAPASARLDCGPLRRECGLANAVQRERHKRRAAVEGVLPTPNCVAPDVALGIRHSPTVGRGCGRFVSV
jgi:hypothetical protein